MLISSGKAVGVEYLQNGRREVVGASKEVILSAGPIHSPHILMLSGVGPRNHLQEHKVDTPCKTCSVIVIKSKHFVFVLAEKIQFEISMQLSLIMGIYLKFTGVLKDAFK